MFATLEKNDKCIFLLVVFSLVSMLFRYVVSYTFLSFIYHSCFYSTNWKMIALEEHQGQVLKRRRKSSSIVYLQKKKVKTLKIKLK